MRILDTPEKLREMYDKIKPVISYQEWLEEMVCSANIRMAKASAVLSPKIPKGRKSKKDPNGCGTRTIIKGKKV